MNNSSFCVVYGSSAALNMSNPIASIHSNRFTGICNRQYIKEYCPDAIEGTTNTGQVFWVFENNLLFLSKDNLDTTSFKNIVTSYLFPTADWLYKSLMSKEYLLYIPEYTKWYVEPLTTIEIARRADEARKVLEKRHNEMRSLGLVINDQTFDLYMKVLSFDYTYHYSDDISVWRFNNTYEKKLDQELKAYPELERLKASLYKSK